MITCQLWELSVLSSQKTVLTFFILYYWPTLKLLGHSKKPILSQTHNN